MHDIAYKIFRPYTIYTIVRESYEHKDFTQGLWELWDTVGILMNRIFELDENCSSEEKDEISDMIDKISDGVVNNYWEYIDNLFEAVKKRSGKHTDEWSECACSIEQMKTGNIVDEKALELLRRLEESVY